MTNINELIFAPMMVAEKIKAIDELSDLEVLKVSTSTIFKIIKEFGTESYDNIKFYPRRQFRKGNDWNSTIEGVGFNTKTKKLWVDIYVQGDDTDCNDSEYFEEFFAAYEYRDTFDLGSEKALVQYSITDKANVMRGLLYEYVNRKGDTKQEEKKESSPRRKKYDEFKSKHPDALLLYRVGDFYESYYDDAESLHQILGLTLCKNDEGSMAGFPHHALDTYIHKIVRAGKRVAIVDEVEEKKPKTKAKAKRTTKKKLADYDNKVHNDSATKFFETTDTLTEDDRKAIRTAVENDADISKELFDKVEEAVYDWCEDNNVDYETFFVGCRIGKYLAKHNNTK